jgi:hypothetical protein
MISTAKSTARARRYGIRLELKSQERNNGGMNSPSDLGGLRKAIERGLLNGNLGHELRDLGELRDRAKITSAFLA